jgi:hypothetical protein
MSNDPSKAKWHEIDSTAARRLTEQTATPGLVYPVAPDAIPAQLKTIPGAVDYYVSSYATPIPLTSGITAGGEIAVIRLDEGIGKADNYIFATSSNRLVYFTGPYKGIPSHHFTTSVPVPINGLFGHPFTQGKT